MAEEQTEFGGKTNAKKVEKEEIYSLTGSGS